MRDFLSFTKYRYRYFGNPNQFKVRNKEELIEAIENNNGYKDCFLSIAEFDSIGNIIPIWFFIDLDGNYDSVNDDAVKILNFLEGENLNYTTDVSGYKGIHILIELDPFITVNNHTFKKFGRFLQSKLELKTIDSHCFDIRRLKRIPGTVNIKSGRLCTTFLKREGKLLNIYDYLDNFEDDIKCGVNILSEDAVRFPFNITSFNPPCIFNRVKNKEVDHKIRWMYVKILQERGLNFNEIYNQCKSCGWSDFDSHITAYQIKYTMERNYVINCKRDICLSSCPLRKGIKKRLGLEDII